MITKLGMLFWLILTTIGMSIMCHIKLIAGISMEDKMDVSYSHVLMDLTTEFQFSSSVISTRMTRGSGRLKEFRGVFILRFSQCPEDLTWNPPCALSLNPKSAYAIES